MPAHSAAHLPPYDNTSFSIVLENAGNSAWNSSVPNMYLMDQQNDTNSALDSMADSETLEVSKDAFFYIRLYTLPIIGFIGVVGNVLSVPIFLGSNHRQTSCSLYLAAKSVMDTGFIITLFVAWLDFIDVRVFHISGVCQVTVFASYVCSFLSVSLVVCVTIENYIRICKPTKVNLTCTPKIAQYVIITLFIVSFVIYNLPLWALEVQDYGDHRYCLTLKPYKKLELILTYVDTFLTLVLPLLVIMILLLLIFCNAVEAAKRDSRLRQRPSSRRPHTVVTRLLSSVSIMFLVLHTPLHVIRIKVIIESLLGDISTTSNTDRHLQHIFVTMYYMNFSVNFFIYVMCGRQFRHVFLGIFCKCCTCNCTCHVDEQDDERFSLAITMTDIIDKESEDTNLPTD